MYVINLNSIGKPITEWLKLIDYKIPLRINYSLNFLKDTCKL